MFEELVRDLFERVLKLFCSKSAVCRWGWKCQREGDKKNKVEEGGGESERKRSQLKKKMIFCESRKMRTFYGRLHKRSLQYLKQCII